MKFIKRELLDVAPTDSKGGPHHVCGVALCSAHLRSIAGNKSIISISVIQETIMYQYSVNNHVIVMWEYEIIVSIVTEYSCNDDTSTWNNSVQYHKTDRQKCACNIIKTCVQYNSIDSNDSSNSDSIGVYR